MMYITGQQADSVVYQNQSQETVTFITMDEIQLNEHQLLKYRHQLPSQLSLNYLYDLRRRVGAVYHILQ